MIRLVDHLAHLAREPDRRRLVAALCACARQHPPSLADPARRAVIEAAEGWVAGGPAPDVEGARRLRGGLFAAACARVIEASEPECLEITDLFGRQLPTAAWFASAHGRLWAAEHDPEDPVTGDPEAVRAIAATEARLVLSLLEA